MHIRQMVELWDFCVFTNEWVSVEMRRGVVGSAVKLMGFKGLAICFV